MANTEPGSAAHGRMLHRLVAGSIQSLKDQYSLDLRGIAAVPRLVA